MQTIDPSSPDYLRAARFGSSFRTPDYTLALENGLRMRTSVQAVAAYAPDSWDIYQTMRFDDPALPDQTLAGNNQRGLSFLGALQEVTKLEKDIRDRGGSAVAGDTPEAMGFDHYIAFGVREGVVLDSGCNPHPVIEGKVAGAGQFPSGTFDAVQKITGVIQAKPDAPQPLVWRDAFLKGAFDKVSSPVSIDDAEKTRINMIEMNRLVFTMKQAVTYHQWMIERNFKADDIDVDEFRKASDWKGWAFNNKEEYASWVKTGQLQRKCYESSLQILDKIQLPEDKKQELLSFICAQRISYRLDSAKCKKVDNINLFLGQDSGAQEKFTGMLNELKEAVESCQEPAKRMGICDDKFRPLLETSILTAPRPEGVAQPLLDYMAGLESCVLDMESKSRAHLTGASPARAPAPQLAA